MMHICVLQTNAIHIFYFDHVHRHHRCIHKVINNWNLYKVSRHFQRPRNKSSDGNVYLTYNNIYIHLLGIFSKQIKKMANQFNVIDSQDCDLGTKYPFYFENKKVTRNASCILLSLPLHACLTVFFHNSWFAKVTFLILFWAVNLVQMILRLLYNVCLTYINNYLHILTIQQIYWNIKV